MWIQWINYKTVNMRGTYSSLRKAFEFCLNSFTVKYKTLPQSRRRNIKVNKFTYRTPWLPDFLCNHWFMSSVWNFCCWGPDIPPGQMPFRQGAKRDIAFSSFRLKQEGEKGSEKNFTLAKILYVWTLLWMNRSPKRTDWERTVYGKKRSTCAW